MATEIWCNVSKENTNYAKICKLIIDGGTRALREVFYRIHPPHLLRSHLLDHRNHAILKTLQTKRVLSRVQWNKLYPTGGSTVDSYSFDITLLYLLLRNICNLSPPTEGWSKLPAPTSRLLEDDIVRINYYRNEIYANRAKPALSDDEFNKYWDEISVVLVRLGGQHYQAEIDKLKMGPIFTEEQKYYTHCFDELFKIIDIKATEVMEASKNRLIRKTDEAVQKVDEIRTHLKTADKVDEKLEEVEKATSMLYTSQDSKMQDPDFYSQQLKRTTKKQLDVHQKFVISPFIDKLKIEDIFTNLLMHHGPRKHSKPNQSDVLEGKVHTEIHKSEDLFLDSEKTENPMSILIVGNPGIGKSLFCKKLVQEWAEDNIFTDLSKSANIPDFKFTFLITLRHLNVLGERNLDLGELLNLSSMVSKDVMVNSSVMDYIIEHPEKVLILMDGYDEYQGRHKMDSDLESFFPDDPKSKMPMTALVSKLVKKKILSDSVVMVTSRPGEADKMKNLHFQRYIEITGFSKQQVIEYVEKHFKSNEELKTKALASIKDNQYLLSFGRVPLMSSLMCVYMEKNIKNSRACFPSTLTELYSDVLEFAEKNYNYAISKDVGTDETAISSMVRKNLEKLSELSARLIVEERYSFYEEDLRELNLSEEEMPYLKSSSLFFCDANARNFPALSEVAPQEYSFFHKSVQEYLAARHFVRMNEIPTQNTLNEMTMQFMAGSMDPLKDQELMNKLLEYIDENVECEYTKKRVLLNCLYEYNDRELAKNVIKNNQQDRYWDSCRGWIDLSNVDTKVIAMLVDTISLLNQEQSFPSSPSSCIPHQLYISDLPFSCSDVDTLFRSLSDEFCTVTELTLLFCSIDDEGAQCVSKYLPQSKLTDLDLSGNEITVSGALPILSHCNKVTNLHLTKNQLSNGVLPILQSCNKPTHLVLAGNEMTDNGLYSILPFCNELTYLDLTRNNITDIGVEFILPYCKKLTHLELTSNQLTDKGVLSILPYCSKLCYLNLAGNCITDECKEHVQRQLFVYPSVKYYI